MRTSQIGAQYRANSRTQYRVQCSAQAQTRAYACPTAGFRVYSTVYCNQSHNQVECSV
jgi:hypothetical protein